MRTVRFKDDLFSDLRGQDISRLDGARERKKERERETEKREREKEREKREGERGAMKLLTLVV